MDTKTPSEMIREFHSVFPQAFGDPELRGRLLDEESKAVANEMVEDPSENLLSFMMLAMAQKANVVKTVDVDLEGLAKQLADLAYVVHGIALVYGIDLDIAFRQVHESNMTKVDDEGRPLYEDSGRVMKGPNYKAPMMAPALID